MAANNLENPQFWRDAQGREVDFLVPAEKLAIEVKYQEHITSTDEKHLSYFLERNQGWKGLIITKKDESTAGIPRTPLWKWLLARKPR